MIENEGFPTEEQEREIEVDSLRVQNTILENENSHMRELLIESMAALLILAEENDGCEPGNSYNPGFTCGFHRLTNRIADVVGEEEIEDEF